MSRWEDRALAFCWIACIVGMGSISLSYGILFVFFANAAQFPGSLFLILMGSSLMVLGPLGRRLMPNVFYLFAGAREGDSSPSRGETLWFGWFSVLLILFMILFPIEEHVSTYRLEIIGAGVVWGISIVLGYRFVPSRSRRRSRSASGPVGRDIYLEDDE